MKQRYTSIQIWMRFILNTFVLGAAVQVSTIALWMVYLLLGFFASGSKHLNGLSTWPIELSLFAGTVFIAAFIFNIYQFKKGAYDSTNPIFQDRSAYRKQYRQRLNNT